MLQVYAGSPKVKDVLAEASAAKAKAVFVTVGAGTSAGGTGSGAIDWAGVDAVVKATSLPVIVKGITTPAEAKEAIAHGAKGVVVSNYRGGNAAASRARCCWSRPSFRRLAVRCRCWLTAVSAAAPIL